MLNRRDGQRGSKPAGQPGGSRISRVRDNSYKNK